MVVRSEELGVRSEGRGAQNLEAPQYSFLYFLSVAMLLS